MTQLRLFLTLAAGLALGALTAGGQQEPLLMVEALSPDGWVEMDRSGTATATNGVRVIYGNALLTAERVRVDQTSGEVEAAGRVRIQRDDQIWAGEEIRYNFKTRSIEAAVFRTGKSPVFAEGAKLTADTSNSVYLAQGSFVTTDDVSEPFTKLRASSLTIIPGKSITARHATMYVGGLPVFYLPYFTYNLNNDLNQFTFLPGYRSSYGYYLLSSYRWFYNEALDGSIHLDYRTKRGVGTGPDLNLHLGRWGEMGVKYYYLYDQEPGTNSGGFANPDNRQRFQFSYDATPWTNFNIKSQVRYQSDEKLLSDFFEGDYRRNPQPTTFVELNKLSDNFSLDVLTQPRVNNFYDTVESLPDVKLTGFRQQVGNSPVFYESESSAGYYRRLFAETNNVPSLLDFEGARADTYHQFTLPQTFFGWLNVIPRVGGRLDYYSHATGPGATTDEEYRGVFNTGAEITFKASRLWPAAESKLLDVNGLRHIVQPSFNYVYVPNPNVLPGQLPQFSYESPSLRLLPIEYTDYNSIDSVDSQNVIRLGLGNKLQTKRNGQLEDLLRWDLYTDWRLQTQTNQTTFADLWSDLVFRPRNWLALESQIRYDVDQGDLKMAFSGLTLTPNNRWSWSLGNFYLRDDFSGPPTGLGVGGDTFRSAIFYRLNEDWAFRASHYYDVRNGRMQEQFYTLYHDFRSWTGALSFRVRDNTSGREDFTIAFTFSLKAFPSYRVGQDSVQPSDLMGR